jgi:cytochrome c5
VKGWSVCDPLYLFAQGERVSASVQRALIASIRDTCVSRPETKRFLAIGRYCGGEQLVRACRMHRVLIIAICAAAIACGGEGKQIPRTNIADPGEAIFNGYTKPNVKCYECHDGTGHGTKWGPALATRVPRLDDSELKHKILDGYGKMPAFRGKLSDDELAQLVAWLRRTFGSSRAS